MCGSLYRWRANPPVFYKTVPNASAVSSINLIRGQWQSLQAAWYSGRAFFQVYLVLIFEDIVGSMAPLDAPRVNAGYFFAKRDFGP